MAAASKPRLSLRDILTDGRIALMLPLGFSAGLPFLLVFGTLSAWLREAGISRTEIGLLSWVASPIPSSSSGRRSIDRYDVPVLARLLGRRRGWMALSQIVIALGLVGIALERPADRPVADRRVGAPRRLRVGDAGRGDRRLAHRRGVRPSARA